MIYTKLKNIKYSYLRKTAQTINKKFPLVAVYLDPRGEVMLTIEGKLTDKEIVEILRYLCPQDAKDINLEYKLHYSYSDDMKNTYVYSIDGIDYRQLLW